MKINALKLGMPGLWLPQKLLLILKITIFFIFACIMSVSAGSFAQRITLSEKNVPLKTVLEKIRRQSGFDLVGGAEVINSAKKVSINVQSVSLEQALDLLLAAQHLNYKIKDSTILISKRGDGASGQDLSSFTIVKDQVAKAYIISGMVTDSDTKLPVEGAIVEIEAYGLKVVTDKNGKFSVAVPYAKN